MKREVSPNCSKDVVLAQSQQKRLSKDCEIQSCIYACSLTSPPTVGGGAMRGSQARGEEEEEWHQSRRREAAKTGN